MFTDNNTLKYSHIKNHAVSICIYSVLALLTFIIYWQVHEFDFINYDDNHYISENHHVLTGLNSKNIVWAFTTRQESNWHPVTWLSLMLDCQLFGSNPGWSHLVNLFLHIANTLLLFAVLKKMTGDVWPSAFVAALFALHPMHVQSVAWISERKDVLSTLFFMLTLLMYVNYVLRPSWLRYIGAIVVFTIGLLAKPMLVTLPFVLLLVDYWPLNRFDSAANLKTSNRRHGKAEQKINKIIIEKIPFFAIATISGVVTFFVQRASGTVADIKLLSFEDRLANVFLSYAKYIGKLFWPQNLSVFYPLNTGGITNWQIWACVLLLLSISILVIHFRSRRYLAVGWFWFIGTLVPVIGIVQVGTQAFADRYTYIPYIGLFIMIAWGGAELSLNRPYLKIISGISMAAIIAAFGICTFYQAGYWKNSVAIFSHAIETTDNNYLAHCNLAKELRAQGKTAQAIEHFKKSYHIAPNYPDTVNGLGCALFDNGNIDEAIYYFQRAIEVRPDSPYARNNLGFALEQKGRINEAVDLFRQAVQLKPDFEQAQRNLANALAVQGKTSEPAANSSVSK
jgi:hypothetical protein